MDFLVVVTALPMLIAAVITPKQNITLNTNFVDDFIWTPLRRKTGTKAVVISITHDSTADVRFSL